MNFIKKLNEVLFKGIKAINLFPTLYEIYLENHYQRRRNLSRNPFFKSFKRYSIYSQSDEDSIINEIIKRLNIKRGIFIELGVGDGTQNNTLNLLAQDWKGIWIGNEELKFKPGNKLKYVKNWITKNNINEIISSNINFLTKKNNREDLNIDLLSIDLDGNDFDIWQNVLESPIKPKIIVAEYNGSVGPRAYWKMPYNKSNNWKSRRDNYFGASFMTLVKLFEEYNFAPICCNTDTGVNLFLVRNEYKSKFNEIEGIDLDDIYEPPHYALSMFSKTHKFSVPLLEEITD